ncbi:MAG: TIGR01212 family radical SAM protein [Clostridiales bacterium]|nr:TIGR01212 family radical SAM protein [Clostridiales bacterium]
MENTTRINMIGPWLEAHFGGKVVKLPLDGGFTCPNRDGTCGTGGCIFCSPAGSGESAVPITEDTAASHKRISQKIGTLQEKWPEAQRFLAYFQNYTSTYAPAERLRTLYAAALSHQGIAGLVVATRPDCLPAEVLDLLSELNERTFLWVELGLQTIHSDTINRGYPLAVYDRAVQVLEERGIRTVTHLLFGLPGESRRDMLDSVRYVCRRGLFGLKFHMLNVVRGSALAETMPDYLPFRSPEDYVDLVVDALKLVPPEMTIHRLTGDVPYGALISPPWAYQKRTVTNAILHELKARDIWQGMDRETP